MKPGGYFDTPMEARAIKKIFSTLLDDQIGLPKKSAREGCWCYNCLGTVIDDHGWPRTMSHFIVCPNCGNKRCPRATDHNLACTGSNDLGQPGSRY